MYTPKFSVTNHLLNQVSRIEAAKEVIGELNSLRSEPTNQPAFPTQDQVFYGVKMEGNPLSEEQVLSVLSGEVIESDDLSISEVKNYQAVLEFVRLIVGRVGVGRPYILTLETILELHRLLSRQLLPNGSCGSYRQRQVILRHVQSGKVSYTPPPAAEVPYLVEDLSRWINSEESKLIHPIIRAAIIHCELYRIHPFLDFNNQVARFTALLVLYLEGYGLNGALSLDKVFSQDVINYHLAMQGVANEQVIDIHERDLTPWITYFVDLLAGEFVGLWQLNHKIFHQHKTELKDSNLTQMTARQLVILEYLRKHHSMRNKDFRKIFPDFSDDTVLRELKFLIQRGLVQKQGGTKMAAYILK